MELGIIISLGILLVGIILFFIFANRRSYRQHSKPVEHYKETRDQLSDVEPEELVDEEDDEPSFHFGISQIITAFIAIIILLAVMPIIASTINSFCNPVMNVSSSGTANVCDGPISNILAIVPIVFILATMVVVANGFYR